MIQRFCPHPFYLTVIKIDGYDLVAVDIDDYGFGYHYKSSEDIKSNNNFTFNSIEIVTQRHDSEYYKTFSPLEGFQNCEETILTEDGFFYSGNDIIKPL